MTTLDSIQSSVRDYYGAVLSSSNDLQTNACCTGDSTPGHVKSVLAKVHDEVVSRFYGCGSPIPPALEGATVLDLGCGTGRDVYVCSALVGAKGRVIGVDMTAEQLEVAERHRDYHAEAFGHCCSNVSFRHGTIEDLAALDIADNSVDVVISNCVINLSGNKQQVFSEIFRVLKPGGELYFSDVFVDRRIPAELAGDPVLLGECLGGALYREDFRRMLAACGCADHRVVDSRVLTIDNPEIEARLAAYTFTSETVRAFKLPLEDRCEDYGQVVTYRGTAAEAPVHFVLDDRHVFEAGRPMLVCGNTADMLSGSRYAAHFEVRGDKSRHFGLFDCSTPMAVPGATAAATDAPAASSCC